MSVATPDPGPASLLPQRSPEDGALFYVIAIIIFLACVSALMTRAAFVSAASWRADMNGAMTVQIKDMQDQAAKVTLAAKTLRAMPGIAAVRVHDRAYARALLEPWLGAGNIPDDLPLPVIVAVRLKPGAPQDKAGISAALARAGINAEVDDHRRWSDELNRGAQFLQFFSIIALSLLVSAAIAVIGFATRANLAARRNVVNTLHLAGAFDSFIARQFARRFGLLGLRAGFLGAALAGLAVGAAELVSAQGSKLLLPVFHLDLPGYGIVLLAPLLAALAGALTARQTVLASLKERE